MRHMTNRLELHLTNGERLAVDANVGDFIITNRMAGNALVGAKEDGTGRMVHVNPEHIVYIRVHGPDQG